MAALIQSTTTPSKISPATAVPLPAVTVQFISGE